MNILLISTSYPTNNEDWRGRFIADMAESLSRCHDIRLKTWMPPGSLPPGVSDAALAEESQWLVNLLAQGGIAHILRTKGIKGMSAVFGLLRRLWQVFRRESDIDVLHVNWLQNALPLWGNNRPAVISVLGSDYKLLQIPGMILLLRQVFKQRKCVIAPNAQWMGMLLEKKFGDIAEIHPVPFGVHQRWFDIVRQKTQSKRLWLIVSRLTHNKIGPLFEWGERVFTGDDELHLFGPMQDTMSVPKWVHYHGATYPEALEKEWFPKASGLVTLSRHDEGRPQVMIEAMAAGLPVIASDLIAHRDIIRDRETGWIVRSVQEFEEAISFLSDPKNNDQMGTAAHEWIVRHIGTWQDCAKRYADIYRKLTG